MAVTEEVYFPSPIPGHEYTFRLSNLNTHERAWLVQKYPGTFPEWIADPEEKPTNCKIEEPLTPVEREAEDQSLANSNIEVIEISSDEEVEDPRPTTRSSDHLTFPFSSTALPSNASLPSTTKSANASKEPPRANQGVKRKFASNPPQAHSTLQEPAEADFSEYQREIGARQWVAENEEDLLRERERTRQRTRQQTRRHQGQERLIRQHQGRVLGIEMEHHCQQRLRRGSAR
ncbi:MAG: hypothetical protein Q9208_003526 [Pyrenodesmia sp. 3 TL-2023]